MAPHGKDSAYENDFALSDNWVPTRFLLLELMGTYFYTLISAGIVISSAFRKRSISRFWR